ncbi:MAG TPA: hypothetical protein DD414_03385 [Lachnospiraceae bacterium]|nr:hypothetical protein [Lachnospiraceae bacterium]
MDDKKKNSPPKVSLILRVVVSVYLLYLAWGLRGAPASHTGMERLLFIGAILLFSVIGVLLGGFSIKAYLNGEYEQSDDDSSE